MFFKPLLAFLASFTGIYVYYVVRRIAAHFGKKIAKRRAYDVIFAAALVVVFFAVSLLWNLFSMFLLHFIFFSALADLGAFFVRTVFAGHSESKAYGAVRAVYRFAVLPLLLTVAFVSYGLVNFSTVVRKDYSFASEKLTDDYKIVFASDIHYGGAQSKKTARKYLREISDMNADVIILGGDIVEEESSAAEMKEIFSVLGELESKYGVYYVFGNHDRQPYISDKDYDEATLREVILSSGIKIIDDSYVEIGEELVVVGRFDARNNSGRASTEAILTEVSRDKYIIVADHQPVDIAENDAQGVDLQISGHTHAGQLWPIGMFMRLSGGYDYGLFREGDCNVVVSSGFAGWGFPIRTERHCEYVAVTLTSAKS